MGRRVDRVDGRAATSNHDILAKWSCIQYRSVHSRGSKSSLLKVLHKRSVDLTPHEVLQTVSTPKFIAFRKIFQPSPFPTFLKSIQSIYIDLYIRYLPSLPPTPFSPHHPFHDLSFRLLASSTLLSQSTLDKYTPSITATNINAIAGPAHSP